MTNFIILLLFTVLSIFTFTASAELQDKPSPSQAAALDTTSATIDAPNTDIMSKIKLESNTDPLQAQPENMNSGYQPWAANDNGLPAVSTAQEIGASSDDLSVNSLQDFDLARIRSRRRGGRRGRLSRFRGSRGRFRGRWFRHVVMPVAGMIGAPMMQPGVMTAIIESIVRMSIFLLKGVVPGAGMMPEIMAPADTTDSEDTM
ncbi:hypothetical protein BC938DRAFT_474157 [Jimgerdemannia flammicorona]|uniref:Uncharacterized protein n=1 Tax=Jimgerdemannia flammicorona TaxID=994334 RepID=A0A433QSR4_9FUNG|nr:hypothetical protein BC938DRAFT_474157 [Jimgerdemannia flammicorona]